MMKISRHLCENFRKIIIFFYWAFTQVYIGIRVPILFKILVRNLIYIYIMDRFNAVCKTNSSLQNYAKKFIYK